MTAMDCMTVATHDGLKLEVFATGEGTRTPALCIPGLTRNAADFEDLAPHVAATGRRVFRISLRGRGGSEYDPNHLNYHPATYRDDVLSALDQLDIERAVFIGTSLGGIVTMLVAEVAPERVAGAIINDVGPETAPEGIARIASYVAARADAPAGMARDLGEAATQIRAINEPAFPRRDEDFWRAFARRTFRQIQDGSWTLDYDARIGAAFRELGPAPDLWPAFASLKEIPTLVVRGAISDLLNLAIIEKMRAVRPGFAYAEVAGVGHAPMLTEPPALMAITDFLEHID